MTCSAKSNDNIDNIFSNIQTEALRLIKEEKDKKEEDEPRKNFTLKPLTSNTKKSCC